MAYKSDLKDVKNGAAYEYLIVLSMVYVTIMICNATLTNRYVGGNDLFILGGTLTSPFVFILDDIITEIYGYRLARSLIVIGFFSQLLFSVLTSVVVMLPYPAIYSKVSIYSDIFGYSLLRITLTGFFAYIFANILNSYIIARWKILLKGRYFWLRSIGSSIVAEGLYTFLAVLIMELNLVPFCDSVKIAMMSFLIKILYSLLFCIPANILTNHIKYKTGVDVYEFPEIFTPHKFKKEESCHV